MNGLRKFLKLLWVLFLLVFMSLSAYASEFPAETVYSKFGSSVVAIWGSGEKTQGSIGAGSLISKDGLVVTNAHVISVGSTGKLYPQISIFLKPERLTGNVKKDLSKGYAARVLAVSKDLDLALLKINQTPSNLNIICIASPDDVRIGQEVVAIGHPEQGGFWSLTYGRISGEFSDFGGIRGKDMYQTDTSVNRGNSGGPLLDSRGCMVGINTSIARRSNDGLAITGINFALKSEVVHEWFAQQGLNLAYMTPAPPAKTKAKNIPTSKTIPEVGRHEVEPKPKIGVKPKTQKTRTYRFKTPKRPYDYNNLIKVEKELEDMMKDMRGKIR